MPTYEYKCRDCGCTFEQFQNMRDEPAKRRPQCGGSVHRLISGGIGVFFRGSKSDAKNTVPVCGRDKPCCDVIYPVTINLVNLKKAPKCDSSTL